MAWGENKQSHYTAGRELQEVKLEQIEGICSCGYLTLNPSNDFEQHNGGLTVKRSKVRIVRQDGSTVKQLRGKQFNRYGGCNACVNGWK